MKRADSYVLHFGSRENELFEANVATRRRAFQHLWNTLFQGVSDDDPWTCRAGDSDQRQRSCLCSAGAGAACQRARLRLRKRRCTTTVLLRPRDRASRSGRRRYGCARRQGRGCTRCGGRRCYSSRGCSNSPAADRRRPTRSSAIAATSRGRNWTSKLRPKRLTGWKPRSQKCPRARTENLSLPWTTVRSGRRRRRIPKCDSRPAIRSPSRKPRWAPTCWWRPAARLASLGCSSRPTTHRSRNSQTLRRSCRIRNTAAKRCAPVCQ